ncbi:NUAK family SNF1-like kinase 2 [Xenopus tropicalis]|nr:NUAK family SNF1-like kinase 2 [Xenopus tropicalis]AAI66319.1 LOC100158605 protein [Xenopus tropicalis]|eukprot:NP_001121499.1 NUAK family SNF1-like kinase 2 [Xenopus tropicalis]
MEHREAGLRRQAVKRHLHKHNLKHRYEFLETLGKGTYGRVKRARDSQGREVAIKSIRKDRIKDEQDMLHIRRETEIMSSLCHPHIISIYEVFENSSKIVIVMEYASQGDLYDYISERQRLSDHEARRFFRQIVSAVQYCHANGIVHRDLKLENILLDENKNVKIADFGLSNIYNSESYLQTYCGSPLYASPEIVNGRPYVGPEVDSWSLGVLLYILVHGCMPFDGQDYKKLVAQISSGAYKEPTHPSDACGLIRWLLMVNPERRATLADVASHWWVNWGYTQPLTEPEHFKDTESPLAIVGGWLRRSSRPLWDNNSKMRCFLRQHLPGGTITRQRSLKRSKKENNINQGAVTQTPQEKIPSVPPAPKKGILKKPQQRESGYYSSPEHNEDLTRAENIELPPSPLTPSPPEIPTCNTDSDRHDEPAPNGGRKGILKRNGKFSSPWAAPHLTFDALDCPLNEEKMHGGFLPRDRASSSISQESILSTESFELLDFPGKYRERTRGKTRLMRNSLSAEDLLQLDEGDKKDVTQLRDMACYRARVAESCLSLGAGEEEVMQVYRSAVLIGQELR